MHYKLYHEDEMEDDDASEQLKLQIPQYLISLLHASSETMKNTFILF